MKLRCFARAALQARPALFAVVLLLTAAAGPLRAQSTNSPEAEQLRREMRQIQSDYEQKMQALEQRINALSGTNAAATPATSAPPAAPTLQSPPAGSAALAGQARSNSLVRARAFARESFLADTETAEYARSITGSGPVKERVEHMMNDFIDINGYFRAGYGKDDKGGPQVAFQAPGALSKYRLGNEAEDYGELAFGKNFYVPELFKLDAGERTDGTPTGPIARVQARISIYNPYNSLQDNSGTQFGLPEAWGAVGNVFAAQPEMKFWAGIRYYRRYDIHISDFFYYNMSGSGGGMEDLQLPFGKLALAWIGSGGQSGFSDLPAPDPDNKAGFSKANWDVRLYDVPVPLGKAEFGFVFANATSGLDSNGNTEPSVNGWALTALHLWDGETGSGNLNRFSLQYGTGAAITFTSGFETVSLTNGVFIRPQTEDSWRFRVTEHFIRNINEYFSIGPELLYQITEYRSQGGQVQWLSSGVRPIFYLNRYVNLAFEGGVDWVKDDGAQTSGYLYKLTLAPEVSMGNQFMSRPAIRAFVTYAHWANAFVGAVGGNDYADDNEGLTYGIQMEAWW